ncbi:hypothetical protein O0L34_g11762 [Tuta absoluta]|nr:hypothetical protein O0L34_g11762 [Tuta absoluta]
MKEFICETCGKAFSNRTLLNMHQTMHTGERKYHCAHCGFRCTQKQNLISHIRTHTKERPFQCDMCPARWTTQSSLQRHRRSHFGIKLHKCHYDNCDKKFAYPVSLKEHIAINHEGTASYPCTFCGQVYLRKGHLRKHWKKKHPEQATFMIQQTPGRRPNYEKGLP